METDLSFKEKQLIKDLLRLVINSDWYEEQTLPVPFKTPKEISDVATNLINKLDGK